MKLVLLFVLALTGCSAAKPVHYRAIDGNVIYRQLSGMDSSARSHLKFFETPKAK